MTGKYGHHGAYIIVHIRIGSPQNVEKQVTVRDNLITIEGPISWIRIIKVQFYDRNIGTELLFFSKFTRFNIGNIPYLQQRCSAMIKIFHYIIITHFNVE